jgi:hypothetical protein
VHGAAPRVCWVTRRSVGPLRLVLAVQLVTFGERLARLLDDDARRLLVFPLDPSGKDAKRGKLPLGVEGRGFLADGPRTFGEVETLALDKTAVVLLAVSSQPSFAGLNAGKFAVGSVSAGKFALISA